MLASPLVLISVHILCYSESHVKTLGTRNTLCSEFVLNPSAIIMSTQKQSKEHEQLGVGWGWTPFGFFEENHQITAAYS